MRCLGFAFLMLGGVVASRADDPNGRWSRLGPGMAPWQQSLVVDPVRDQMLLLDAASSREACVWVLDNRTEMWSEIQEHGPAPTASSALAAFHDPNRDRFVVLDAASHEAWTLDRAGLWNENVTVAEATTSPTVPS